MSRDRSPIRSDSSPQIIEVNPSSSADPVKPEAPAVLDMSSKPTAAAAPIAASKDDEIFIVAEKEGNRPPAVGGGGRNSASSDHSIHRQLNGLEADRPHSRQSILHRGSPAVNSAAAAAAAAGGVANGPKPTGPYGHLPSASLPSSYYSRSHMGALSVADPFGRGPPHAAALPPHSSPYAGLDPRMSAGLQDPRTMAMLSAHGMLGTSGLNPFDPMASAMAAAAAADPFRDPYHRATMDLFRDPLREAHDRELLRLNELDRAKALSSLYPPSPYYSPAPPTSLPASMHKLVPGAAASAAGAPAGYGAAAAPGLAPPSLGLPPHLAGLSHHHLGAAQPPGQPYNPLRR